jgi:hypothetical protein
MVRPFIYLAILLASASLFADVKGIKVVETKFKICNTYSDGLTGTATNRLEPGCVPKGGKSMVILPNHQ